jgi:hypothetical protein
VFEQKLGEPFPSATPHRPYTGGAKGRLTVAGGRPHRRLYSYQRQAPVTKAAVFA